MANDTTKRGCQDCDRIDLSEEYEVRYWTEKFDITKLDLPGDEVGPVVKDVGRPLRGS